MKIYFVRISRKRGSIRNVAMDEKTFKEFRSEIAHAGGKFPDLKYYNSHIHGYNLVKSKVGLTRLLNSYCAAKVPTIKAVG